MDAFSLKLTALPPLAVPGLAQTDLAFVVDHPLPGDVGTVPQGGHGITHHPRARGLRQLGDAAIGADPAGRDSADGGVNTLIERVRRLRVSWAHPSRRRGRILACLR